MMGVQDGSVYALELDECVTPKEVVVGGGGVLGKTGSKGGKKDATLTEGLGRRQWAELHPLTMSVSNTGVTGHNKDSGLGEMDQLSTWIA